MELQETRAVITSKKVKSVIRIRFILILLSVEKLFFIYGNVEVAPVKVKRG